MSHLRSLDDAVQAPPVLSSGSAEHVERDLIYTWRGHPLVREGADVHLADGRWWGRILPTAAVWIFDANGEYLADLMGGRVVWNPHKQDVRADRFRGGWTHMTPPADRDPYDPPPASGGDLGARIDGTQEPRLSAR